MTASGTRASQIWTHLGENWPHCPPGWTHSAGNWTHRARNWTHWPGRVDTCAVAPNARFPPPGYHSERSAIEHIRPKTEHFGQETEHIGPKTRHIGQRTEHIAPTQRTHPRSRPPHAFHASSLPLLPSVIIWGTIGRSSCIPHPDLHARPPRPPAHRFRPLSSPLVPPLGSRLVSGWYLSVKTPPHPHATAAPSAFPAPSSRPILHR